MPWRRAGSLAATSAHGNSNGEQDYALHYVMQDDAVNDRCRGPKRWVHPFIDQNKLSARARSVLKSLKIDTELDDTGSRKPRQVK